MMCGLAEAPTVAAYWFENHLRWGKGMTKDATHPERHAEQIRHVENRAEQADELRKAAGVSSFTRLRAGRGTASRARPNSLRGRSPMPWAISSGVHPS
jgi:hypothetical protein